MGLGRPAERDGRPTPRVPWALWAMMGAYAGVLAGLSIARHHAFNTGRFDLGTVVQAISSTVDGRLLETTFIDGTQASRLGAHVDPLLAAFAPLWALWPTPEVLIVAQALLMATGAIPMLWLGRAWLADEPLARAGAGVYLLYPPLQLATFHDIHAVTLAAPLLLFAIWAANAGRWGLLVVFATLATLSKEQVGVAVAGLGVWMLLEARRRPDTRPRAVAGGALVAGGLGWAAFSVLVVIPHFSPIGESPFLGRYSEFGDGPLDVVLTVLARPWEVLALLGDPARVGYLLALLAPLAFLPLAAPLLAAAAAPELVLNLIADRASQYSIAFQYTAVIAPFLLAAALRGLARLREQGRLRASPRRIAAGMVGLGVGATLLLGPLPRPAGLAIVWSQNAEVYRSAEGRTHALQDALAILPDDAPVSVGNVPGAHVSARERVYVFPRLGDAGWVLLDRNRPYDVSLERQFRRLAPGEEPVDPDRALADLLASEGTRVVLDRAGVLLIRRTGR